MSEFVPERRRTLPIVWSCMVRTHEHPTEAEAAECIVAVSGFLEGRRNPPPATAKMLEWTRHSLGPIPCEGNPGEIGEAFLAEWGETKGGLDG